MLGHRDLTAEDFVGILKRRRWLIVIPAIVMPLLAIAVTFVIPPRYVSQTLVLVDQQLVPDTYVKPVVMEDLNQRLNANSCLGLTSSLTPWSSPRSKRAGQPQARI